MDAGSSFPQITLVNTDLPADITSIYLRDIAFLVSFSPNPDQLFFLSMNASNVTFDPPDMYSRDLSKRTHVITLVISQAPEGAVSAVVV